MRSFFQGLGRWALVLAWPFALIGTALRAQSVEHIYVETYHVEPKGGANDEPLTTYRIYVDLAADCELVMVFGSAKHPLRFRTNTEFFNDTTGKAKFGDRVPVEGLNTYPTALDSWLTLGPASKGHMGVPKHLDPDGSMLTSPPYTRTEVVVDARKQAGTSICVSDGLVASSNVKEVVNYKLEPGYLGNIRGGDIHYVDGAWSVLGGTRGVTSENMVLIAQLTTTGSLSYKLNLQVRAAHGGTEYYVAENPEGKEILFEELIHWPSK